jgi:Family of unknown function (DUF6932)
MSSIPQFNHNNVLPPHLGDPVDHGKLSPYPCTILELCKKFSTSKERIYLLKGLLNFRQRMTELNIINGFQWIDGSFVENIEISEKRPPNDIDIITLFGGLSTDDFELIEKDFPEFYNSDLSKEMFGLDHYPFDYCFSPEICITYTSYWIQLFTHNRLGNWKGMLKLEINTPDVDREAKEFLNRLEL